MGFRAVFVMSTEKKKHCWTVVLCCKRALWMTSHLCASIHPYTLLQPTGTSEQTALYRKTIVQQFAFPEHSARKKNITTGMSSERDYESPVLQLL